MTGEQLVDLALGVDPAQGMTGEVEPAAIIADDERPAQQAMIDDAAPLREYPIRRWQRA
jgi:hypothetical protein